MSLTRELPPRVLPGGRFRTVWVFDFPAVDTAVLFLVDLAMFFLGVPRNPFVVDATMRFRKLFKPSFRPR
jgi:hypothetical protein